MISEKRKLVFDLLNMPYIKRFRIFHKLSLLSREEMFSTKMKEIELLKLAINRAQERGQLAECRVAVNDAMAKQEEVI